MLGWAEEVWDPCVNELERAGAVLGGSRAFLVVDSSPGYACL